MGTETTCDAPRRASWLYRLNHTPLRDVFRGQLTGRMDVNAIVTVAELPEPLADLVRRVVRRTRLSRLEKADVARELIAHFEDGLAAGATADDLAASFGDVKQATRLIRRAKLRGRSAMRRLTRLLRYCAQAVLLLFLAVYVIQAARIYSASAKIAHDYVAEWNAEALAVPEPQRAWPVYREAALMTAQWPSLDSSDLKPDGERWPQAKAFAAEHAEVIQMYRRAASMPLLGALLNDERDAELEKDVRRGSAATDESGDEGLGDSPPFISVTLPQLGTLRQAARLLMIDAHTAAAQGAHDRVFANVDAMIGIAEHATQLRFLISDLVALRIAGEAADLLGAVLHEHPGALSDGELTRLSHRFASLRGGGPLRVRFTSVYAEIEDAVQWFYTDDGHGDGLLRPEVMDVLASMGGFTDNEYVRIAIGGRIGKTLLPALSSVMAGRRETLELFHRLMARYEAEGDIPLWQHDRCRADLESERWAFSWANRLRCPIVAIMMPSLGGIQRFGEYATQERDATLAAIALQLHRRRAGDWPDSLDELTPQLLPTVPPDRYDGKALKYRIVEGQPVLYSVGVDRDDDGGRVPDGANGNRRARNWLPKSCLELPTRRGLSPPLPDGDWVLWPPVE